MTKLSKLRKAILGTKLYEECKSNVVHQNIIKNVISNRLKKGLNSRLKELKDSGVCYDKCDVDILVNACKLNKRDDKSNYLCITDECKNKIYYDEYKESLYYEIIKLDCSNENDRIELLKYAKIEEEQKDKFKGLLSLKNSGCEYKYYDDYDDKQKTKNKTKTVTNVDANAVNKDKTKTETKTETNVVVNKEKTKAVTKSETNVETNAVNEAETNAVNKDKTKTETNAVNEAETNVVENKEKTKTETKGETNVVENKDKTKTETKGETNVVENKDKTKTETKGETNVVENKDKTKAETKGETNVVENKDKTKAETNLENKTEKKYHKYIYYIAYNKKDNILGGVCQVSLYKDDKTVHINLLTSRSRLDSSLNNKGIGTTILNRVKRDYENTYYCIELYSVPDAVEFYLNYGFKPRNFISKLIYDDIKEKNHGLELIYIFDRLYNINSPNINNYIKFAYKNHIKELIDYYYDHNKMMSLQELKDFSKLKKNFHIDYIQCSKLLGNYFKQGFIFNYESFYRQIHRSLYILGEFKINNTINYVVKKNKKLDKFLLDLLLKFDKYNIKFETNLLEITFKYGFLNTYTWLKTNKKLKVSDKFKKETKNFYKDLFLLRDNLEKL